MVAVQSMFANAILLEEYNSRGIIASQFVLLVSDSVQVIAVYIISIYW
jgi:hypothetical protein